MPPKIDGFVQQVVSNDYKSVYKDLYSLEITCLGFKVQHLAKLSLKSASRLSIHRPMVFPYNCKSHERCIGKRIEISHFISCNIEFV